MAGGTNLDEFYPEFYDRLICPLKFQNKISEATLLCETLSTHVRTTHTHVQKEKRETEINYTQILHMYYMYTCVQYFYNICCVWRSVSNLMLLDSVLVSRPISSGHSHCVGFPSTFA